MKVIPVFIVCVLLAVLIVPAAAAENIKVLIFASNNYGANHFLKQDNFEQYGWEVTIAGVTRTVSPCPLYAGPLGCPIITVDTLIAEITDISQYDVLVLMPVTWRTGNPHADLLGNQHALDLIAAAVDSGLIIYAHCVGPRVLAAADVLQGVRITGQPAYQAEYIAAGAIYLGADETPVIDGNIVTSTSGLCYNEQNCEAIATALENIRSTNIQDDENAPGNEEEEVK